MKWAVGGQSSFVLVPYCYYGWRELRLTVIQDVPTSKIHKTILLGLKNRLFCGPPCTLRSFSQRIWFYWRVAFRSTLMHLSYPATMHSGYLYCLCSKSFDIDWITQTKKAFILISEFIFIFSIYIKIWKVWEIFLPERNNFYSPQ